MIPRLLLATAATCVCLPAAAVLGRADRDDAEYVELASRYPSSVRLHAPAGEGVLIAERWVVTSTALAKLLREIHPTPAIKVGGRAYDINAIHEGEDIALLLLHEPVRGVLPAAVYRGSDEAGKPVAIVAHGAGGTASAPKAPDGKRRAGINTVDNVAARTFEVRIKSGDDASDLQGILGRGETGAGAYLSDAEGRLFVAGINLSADGRREVYARLSSRFAWIEATMLAVAKAEAERLMAE